MNISVYAICKNEGKTLRRVLKPYREIGAQIIVGVDESSTDTTNDIALEVADRHFRFDWDKVGFDGARNKALELCERDWIFAIDGHEFIAKKSIPYLSLIDNLDPSILSINIKIEFVDQQWKPTYGFFFPRIFRNWRGIEYKGRIHSSLTGLDSNRGYFAPEIILKHRRGPSLSKDRLSQRTRENIPHFRKLSEDGENSRALFYLACAQLESGKIKTAKSSFERYLKISDFPEEMYQARIEITDCLLKTNENSIEAFEEILLSCPLDDWKRNEHLFVLGDLYLRSGVFNKALLYFKLASEYEEPLSLFPYRIDCYRSLPYEKISQTLAKMGRLDEALFYAKKVLGFRRDRVARETIKKISTFMRVTDDDEGESKQEGNCGDKAYR